MLGLHINTRHYVNIATRNIAQVIKLQKSPYISIVNTK